MSVILHRRLHGHSSHLSLTSQHHQVKNHRLIKETMASIHDQLQCCLLFPKTNENKTKHQQHTHTRSKTKTDEALSESTQKQRPTVSANPRLPLEDRRVRQAKLSSVPTTQIKSTFVELKIKLMALLHHADPASDKPSARRAKLRTYFSTVKQTLPPFEVKSTNPKTSPKMNSDQQKRLIYRILIKQAKHNQSNLRPFYLQTY